MDKKVWKDKLAGLEKLKRVAEFNENKARNDQEELSLMISAIKEKIGTFK